MSEMCGRCRRESPVATCYVAYSSKAMQRLFSVVASAGEKTIGSGETCCRYGNRAAQSSGLKRGGRPTRGRTATRGESQRVLMSRKVVRTFRVQVVSRDGCYLDLTFSKHRSRWFTPDEL